MRVGYPQHISNSIDIVGEQPTELILNVESDTCFTVNLQVKHPSRIFNEN